MNSQVSLLHGWQNTKYPGNLCLSKIFPARPTAKLPRLNCGLLFSDYRTQARGFGLMALALHEVSTGLQAAPGHPVKRHSTTIGSAASRTPTLFDPGDPRAHTRIDYAQCVSKRLVTASAFSGVILRNWPNPSSVSTLVCWRHSRITSGLPVTRELHAALP